MTPRRRFDLWTKSRFSVAWNVLRGRPTMYRMKMYGTPQLQPDQKGALIAWCEFRGKP